MTWNHRVIRRKYKVAGQEFSTLSIHEVFYNEKGEPGSCTVDPIDVSCDEDEGLSALRKDLEWMMEALKRPILNYEDFDSN